MNEPLTVLVERCTMQIYPDAFFSRPDISKAKKLLGYVFQEPWRNKETISTLGTYFPQKQAEAKAEWATASKEYQDGYKLPQNHPGQNARYIESQNKKLLAEVKRCKTKYERWGKIIAHFEDLKTKNRIL